MTTSPLADELRTPPFTIKVLDAPLASRLFMVGQPLGTIVLDGRALPYRPITFEGTQRVTTTYYAGNTVATQQVMGPMESPTTITGTFKDKYIGNGQAIALADNLDVIRRAGVQLQVSWGPFLRRGILKRFKLPLERLQDVAWEMEFEWNGRGNTVASPVTATGVQNPREGLQGIVDSMRSTQDGLADFQENPLARVYGFAQDTQIAFDNTINSALNTIDYLDRAAGATTALANVPRYIIEQGIVVCKTARTSLQGLETAITDVPGQLTHAYDLSKELKDSALDLLEYLGNKLGLLQTTSAGKELAVNTLTELDGQLFPVVIAEESPPAGTDLRELALRHYGDPDLWWIIAQYNNITGSEVPPLFAQNSDSPSRPIAIPRRQDGTLADLTHGC